METNYCTFEFQKKLQMLEKGNLFVVFGVFVTRSKVIWVIGNQKSEGLNIIPMKSDDDGVMGKSIKLTFHG